MPNSKILVVDDDRNIQNVMKAILGKAGYQVLSAMDGMQGPMLARQLNPDIIILDINMPAGGGYSVYERLQSLSGTFSIPILIYSAVQKNEILKKIAETETTRILQKPASPVDILAAVQKLLPNA